MILNYITWDVSPFIYEGKHFAIGWYGTLWVLGLLGMLITLLITFKRDHVPPAYAYITFIVSLVCIIFFAHLFQGLFYEWYYAPDNPIHFLGTEWYYRNHYFEQPWRFLDITHGGFASHGVILGSLISGAILHKILPYTKWFIIDRIILGVLWIGVAVRIANLINIEICGVETELPWGFVFGDNPYALHPTQIYELLSYIVAMGIGWWLYIFKSGGRYNGWITSTMLSIVMLLRIAIEFYKQPQMRIEESWSLYMGQWLSIPFAIWAIWWFFQSIEQGQQDITPVKESHPNAKKT